MFRLKFICRQVFLLILVVSIFKAPILNAQSSLLTIKGVRIWHAPDHSRIVFDISKQADYSISLLENPKRYVIDFKNTVNQATLPTFVDNQRIQQLRMSSVSGNQFQYVIPIKKFLQIKNFQLTPNTLYGHRLVIDLYDFVQDKKSISTVKEPVPKSPNQSVNESESPIDAGSNKQNFVPVTQQKRQIIVAIDAGHGGEDPGALGFRSREKDVTLAISKRLAKVIDANPRMKAVLIRTNDYFIRLRNRTNKARKAQADLFISIHADAALNKSARGMSVFALSQRGASSELARALARKENQADLVGGVSIKDKDDTLAEVLLDLSMTNTISESIDLGSAVLKRLARIGKLHSKRVEQAGFAVLKSPDIPSILVETGFITNRSEERLLLSKSHQKRIVDSIYAGIVEYIRQNPIQRANTNLAVTASRQNIDDDSQTSFSETVYHVVESGDSLSKIAFTYGISIKQLKNWNKLKSDVAFKGQRLRVSELSNNRGKNTSFNNNVSAEKGQLITYQVKRGDTLSGIAERYAVTMAAIRKRNKMKNNRVYVGQKLRIYTTSRTKILTRKTVHTVRSGEYLSAISKRYNVSINRLKKLNKLRSNNIYAGQKLLISNSSNSTRNKTTPQYKSIRHIVKRGQTLSGLAVRYKVKQSDIVALNKLKKRELYIGQRLTIRVKQ